MKNRVLDLIIALIAGFAFMGFLMIADYCDTHYTRDALVIYEEDNYVGCVTIDGNEWEFFADGYEEGDEIQVTFYNHLTENDIFDDEITSARKREKNIDKSLKEW